MTDKQESSNGKTRGIFRHRDTASLVSNESIKQRISTYRPKSKVGSNRSTSRSEDQTVSLFSRRSNLNRRDKSAPVTPRINIPDAVSKRPSTITLDSRLTTTSQSSLSHKPGFIPVYMRSKTGTKNLITTQMQSNKKKFIQIKKELFALQDKAVDYYKRYRESLVKFNKLNGNDGPPNIEEIQIVDFIEKSVEETNSVLVSNAESKLNEKQLSDISQQVHGIQEHSFDILQVFSVRLTLINNQMKLAEKCGGGDTNFFPVKIQNLSNEIETKIIEEKAQQTTRLNNFMNDLKKVMINEEVKSSPRELNVTPTENRTNKEFNALVRKLEQFELANKKLGKQLDDKTLELVAKDKSIDELNISVKSMQETKSRTEEEFKNQTDRLKMKCDDENRTKDENLILKNSEQNLMKEIDSLKFSLNEMQLKKTSEEQDKEFDRLNTVITEMKADLTKRDNLIVQRNRKVCELENLIKQLENQNKTHKEEILKLQELHNEKSKEIEKLHFEINKADTELQLQHDSLLMQQRLLTIRGELIQSLQENDDASKNQISELNSEIQRRTYALKQLNKEVFCKTEELETVFSSLGAKSLEVKRQDHVIKLLEETHEKICVTQEGQIAHLEKENEKLKRFIVELNIPIPNSCTNSIEEINLRPYKHFYENFRRQKRNVHTLIKVKKYRN